MRERRWRPEPPQGSASCGICAGRGSTFASPPGTGPRNPNLAKRKDRLALLRLALLGILALGMLAPAAEGGNVRKGPGKVCCAEAEEAHEHLSASETSCGAYGAAGDLPARDGTAEGIGIVAPLSPAGERQGDPDDLLQAGCLARRDASDLPRMSAGKRDGGSLPDALPLAPEFGEAENAPHLALHGDLPADVGSPPAETPDLSVNLLQPGTPSPGAPKAEIPEAANRAPEQAGGDPAPLADGEHFALIDRDQMFPSDAGICVPAEIREPYTFTDAAMESLQVGDRLPGDLGTVSGMEYWTSEDGEEELFLGVLAPEGYEYWYGTARKDGTWRLVGDDDFMLEYPAGSKLLLITPQCEIFDGQNYIDENTALGYLGGGYPTHRVDSIYDLFTVRYEVGGGGYAYDEVSECEICFTVEAGRVTKIYRFYRP